jgi:hypothetical protein
MNKEQIISTEHPYVIKVIGVWGLLSPNVYLLVTLLDGC